MILSYKRGGFCFVGKEYDLSISLAPTAAVSLDAIKDDVIKASRVEVALFKHGAGPAIAVGGYMSTNEVLEVISLYSKEAYDDVIQQLGGRL